MDLNNNKMLFQKAVPKLRVKTYATVLNLKFFITLHPYHRIKISNRRATQRCNVSSFFFCKNMQFTGQKAEQPASTACLLARKWRPTRVMRHARGQKLQSFRRKWPFYMDLYYMSIFMLFSTSKATQHCNAMKYIQLCYFAILTLVSNTAGISIFYFYAQFFWKIIK
jgi:hypothetical protein